MIKNPVDYFCLWDFIFTKMDIELDGVVTKETYNASRRVGVSSRKEERISNYFYSSFLAARQFMLLVFMAAMFPIAKKGFVYLPDLVIPYI